MAKPNRDMIRRMLLPVLAKEHGEDGDEKGDGLTWVVASTDAEDSYRDVVDQESWQLARFTANPVIMYAHDYHGQPVVGRAEKFEVRDGVKLASGRTSKALVMGIKWDTSEVNQLGQLVASQFKGGFLKAVSVGFRSGDYTLRSELPEDHGYHGERGYLLRNNELLEVSAVPIPANPEAVVMAAKGAGRPDPIAVAKAVRDFLQSEEGQVLIGTIAGKGLSPSPGAEAGKLSDWFDG